MASPKAREILAIKLRGAKGKGSMGDARAYLAKSSSNLKRVCATEIAVEFNNAVRAYHSEYVYGFIPDIASNLTDEQKATLLRHSHFKGGANSDDGTAKSFVLSRLFNPLGTMSTAMHVAQKTHKDGTVTVTVHGASIIYQEYGTGTLGQMYPHPHFDRPWVYNSGVKYTDYKTNIVYWVYGQYARIGNPAGHFIYDARNDIIRALTNKNTPLYGTISEAVNKYAKENVSMIVTGLPEKMGE